MTIKDQLGELIKKLEVEEKYPNYVLAITRSQLETLLKMLDYYNKEEN